MSLEKLFPVRRCSLKTLIVSADKRTLHFRITFLPHTLMLEQAENHPETLNTFLICSILTLSAGWTPSIHTHFPTPERATEHYYRLAEAMIGTQLLKPSIESCQACTSVYIPVLQQSISKQLVSLSACPS